jgi:hypothetical protein
MSTFMLEFWDRISRQASIPEASGKRISSTTTSGASSLAFSTASAAVPASPATDRSC